MTDRAAVAAPRPHLFRRAKLVDASRARSHLVYRQPPAVYSLHANWHVPPAQFAQPNTDCITSRVPRIRGLASSSPAANPAATPCCSAIARIRVKTCSFAGGNCVA